jgi:hypothetical protein
MQNQIKKNNIVPALAFALLVSLDLCLFLIPALIIQPFKHQSTNGLTLAMASRQAAPLWTLLATGAALVVTALLWKRVSVWKRVALVLGLCLASAATVMARVDYFEWMFHPVAAPGFESAGRTQLDSSEMVLAVRFGNDARAYPIRAMAYHHVVNDVVGGVPVAVTY